MAFWDKIRGLFRRRRQDGVTVSQEFSQADLRSGQPIRAEPMVQHVVSVAFPRAAIDDETFQSLGVRRHWKELLSDDRAVATRDEAQMGLDDFLLGMLDQEAIVGIMGPGAAPPLPADLRHVFLGFNESLIELAERCDHTLGFAVSALNEQPMRLGWPLAHHLARLAARETGGIICEHLSGRFSSLERWASVNPYPGQGGIGDWVAIHNVADGSGPTQMHTHGMLHFGLPDLEMADVSRFASGGATKLINAACMVLVLRTLGEAGIRVGEEFEITRAEVRRAMRDEDGGEDDKPDGAAWIRLVAGDPEASLVDNRLLRVLPGSRYGKGTEALAACLLALFPEVDAVCDVSDQDAMQAAHEKALETLPAERERFRRGLRPGERFAVKVPFPYGEDEKEYMWVEVQKWEGDGPEATIEGVLVNEPSFCDNLKLGQAISIEQSAVFDWTRITPGGRQEGNFTAAALG